jgi:hypothetical protein
MGFLDELVTNHFFSNGVKSSVYEKAQIGGQFPACCCSRKRHFLPRAPSIKVHQPFLANIFLLVGLEDSGHSETQTISQCTHFGCPDVRNAVKLGSTWTNGNVYEIAGTGKGRA